MQDARLPGAFAVPCDRWLDPAAVFAALWGGSTDVFWLDGGADAAEGWSFLGEGARLDDPSRVAALPVGGGDPDGPAGPFPGGFIGWCGYEPGAAAAGVPVWTDDSGAESEAWLEASRWVACDHAGRRLWAVAQTEADARELAARVSQVVAGPPPVGAVDATTESGDVAHARHRPAEYAALIEDCRAAIRAGDAYQLCLTTRFEVNRDVDPEAVYRRLRSSSRTHRGALIRIGQTSVLSATPEQFLTVRDGVVRTKPIKGTRPRGTEPAEDARLAADLVQDPKERAENVMIVDLMRNDLAQVSEVGSVRVDALLEVESYPHVHQLVSTVSGRLRAGVTLGELLGKTFPAGSMTGAPKRSAMTILHRLEGGPRGVFAGCLGWVGRDGSADLAMVIRTIVAVPGRAFVGAGGGITWSSVAADEVREVGIKARAPLAALGVGLPEGW